MLEAKHHHVRYALGNGKDMQKQAKRNNSLVKHYAAAKKTIQQLSIHKAYKET